MTLDTLNELTREELEEFIEHECRFEECNNVDLYLYLKRAYNLNADRAIHFLEDEFEYRASEEEE